LSDNTVFRPRSYLCIIGKNLLSKNTVATKAARQRGGALELAAYCVEADIDFVKI